MRAVPAALLSCALILALMALPARAIELSLSADAVAAAIGDGRAMAARGEGYTIGEYVLFGVDDAFHITGDDQTIEAVAVGTPFERLRFHAYLLAHEGRPNSDADTAQFLTAHRSTSELVVFVHSRSVADREFMQHFGAGTLDAGGELRAAEVSSTDPVLDSYYRLDGSVLKRWLGVVTYRFDLRDDTALAGAAAPATFSFTDDRGGVHRYTLSLARYR